MKYFKTFSQCFIEQRQFNARLGTSTPRLYGMPLSINPSAELIVGKLKSIFSIDETQTSKLINNEISVGN